MGNSEEGGLTLTHLDAMGAPRMVDVSAKVVSVREALAEGRVWMSPEAQGLLDGGAPKGNVLQIARIAGIQGAKRTADLIPLCHPLPLDGVEVSVEPCSGGVVIQARAKTAGRTGVEMEALTAVSAAALTVYDMLKAVDRSMRIGNIRLLEKKGGRSGHYRAPALEPDLVQAASRGGVPEESG
jgi:cyclic pyranopterin phosphate synthase